MNCKFFPLICYFKLLGFGIFAVSALQPAIAAAQDTIDVAGGRPVRGKIIETSPSTVVVDVSGTQQTVEAGKINRVRLYDAKGDLTRAIDLFYDGNFNNALEVLNSTGEKPATPIVAAEVEYCRAMSMAQEALQGGSVTVREAGIATKQFVETYDQSFHVHEVTRAFADLALASGSIESAKSSYGKLLDIEWPEQVLDCHFQLGLIALLERDAESAANHFAQVDAVDTADKRAQELKIAARCRAAQASAMQGNHEAAIQTLQSVIKNENSEQQIAFSHAYNALGHAYLQANEQKPALLAFLRTQLLFNSRETVQEQAEALFELRKLWESLNYPERARQAQQSLSTSFGNTIYASR